MDTDELKERTENRYQKEKKQQQEALTEIAQGQNLEEYETRELGNAEISVKCWIPGDVTESFADIFEAYDNDNPIEVFRSFRQVARVIGRLCADEPYSNAQFWEQYYDKWGPKGMM